MFLEERQDAIVELLKNDGKVTVHDLSARFSVTEDCIRKDLGTLEKKGLLKRTYGGAVPIRLELETREIIKRRGENLTAKRQMAKVAQEMLLDSDLIFLGISSTSVALAELLVQTESRLCVVTDMLDVMTVLARNPRIRLIGLGGELNASRDGFVSAQTAKLIRELRPSIAFLGATGVDVEGNNFYVDDAEDKVQKQVIMESAERVYIMADESKFLREGKHKFAELQEINGIITDVKPSENICNILEDAHVELLLPRVEPEPAKRQRQGRRRK